MSDHRSGFVGILGRPNVGKSTILNYYLGEKIAIVSPKPQTTRQRILGVFTRPDVQIAFLDTPGFHKPEHTLGRSMVEAAKAVLEEVDVLLVVIDARRGLTADDERLFSAVQRTLHHPQGPLPGKGSRVALLAINKVDLVKKPLLLPLIEQCAARHLFSECIPISALKGDQMDVLLKRLITYLPQGPEWYEPHQRTDQTTRQFISELIREQAILATHEEVPHAIGVILDEVVEKPKVTSIAATLLVERQGQKGILIGRNGRMLKTIGQAARQELERLVGRKVYLELWVKVAEGWRDHPSILRELGY